MTQAVRLLAFAGAADVLRAREVTFSSALPCSARVLFDRVCDAYPALVPYRGSLRLAVNGEWATWEREVRAGDEIALMPPVSGG